VGLDTAGRQGGSPDSPADVPKQQPVETQTEVTKWAASPFERWSPPSFAASFRGPHADPPLDRWEAVLRAERSLPYQLSRLASQKPRLARLVGVPGDLFAQPAKRLEDRERRAARVARTRLGRLLGRAPRSEPQIRLDHTGDGRPKPAPLLDGEIDGALAMLADVPFEELQERGWHLQPNNYAWPLNDVPFLRRNPELWARPRVPRGIEMDVEGQLDLLRHLSRYAHELADVRNGPEHRPGEFVWQNGAFSAADAFAYYGLVRDLKPKRVIEIGAGASSLLLARAVQANDGDTHVTLVEPNPRWDVLGELPSGWEFRHTILQKAGLEMFDELTAGDVVFYDGSHCVETGGDVNWLLFRVFPRLARGVWIHFHDIHWPHDYPAQWVLNEGLTWNEQYFLQAFLMHNSKYRVRLAMAMLTRMRRDDMRELFPDRPFGWSVWIQKNPG
jgi:hypothetical protein